MNYPIIAISTSTQNSAIGIIRISFGNVIIDYDFFFLKIFKKKIKVRYATYVNLYYNNLILDNGLVIFFSKPNSYTGEDILEFHGHGNYLNLKYILKVFLFIFRKYKIRLADKGEFTKRAFFNKKLNLIQVNDLLNLITSNNSLSLKNIHYNFGLNLYSKLKNIYLLILNLKNFLLYNIINFNNNKFLYKINYKLNYILKKVFKIYKNINYFKYIKNSVILLGSPNVGKSTIINKIIKNKSLIVSKKPGTTRDLVSRDIFINNFSINIFDTAGLRHTKNKIERSGIKLALNQIKKSRIILYIYTNKIKKKFFLKVQKYVKNNIFILIFNKIDLYNNLISLEFLLKNKKKNIIIKISAKFNLGINLLYIEINRLFIFNNFFSKNNDFIKKKISKIYNYINNSIIYFKFYDINFLLKNINFLLFYINNILNYNNKKKINNLFKKFCIGK